MIQLSYDEIIEKIKSEKGLPIDEINSRIKTKMDQLSGLISKDGAAYIVANELGIKLIKANGLLKVKDVLAGMRSVETAGRVLRKFDINSFSKDGKSGRVGSFILADETGQIRVTCWHEMCDLMKSFNENDILKVVGGYVRENRGQREIHLNDRSKLILNPEGITIAQLQQRQEQAEAPRKKISELSEQDQNVEILATIVQVFDPRYYEICPDCGKKCVAKDEGFMCEEHGTVLPTYGYVINALLDDGSDNMRAVFFRQQAQRLLKVTDQQMQDLRLAPNFDTLKTELLGEHVRIVGRISKNAMFARTEIIASQVFRDVDPKEEIKRLEKV
jgi:replication factor A1